VASNKLLYGIVFHRSCCFTGNTWEDVSFINFLGPVLGEVMHVCHLSNAWYCRNAIFVYFTLAKFP